MNDAAMIESERAEADAWLDLVAAAPSPLASAIGLVAGRDDSGTWVRCKAIPAGVFNRRFDVPRSRSIADIPTDEGLWLQLPETRADDIASLRARGMIDAPWPAWTKLVWPDHSRAAGTPDPNIGTVARDEALAWAQVIGSAHGMPPAAAPWIAALVDRPRWHTLAWRSEGTIVSGAALFVDEGRAWLGLGGTLPEFRGRGAQSSLLRARIDLARSLGVATIASETGSPLAGKPNTSLTNMLRAGLVSVGQRINLVAR
ncbi:MAG TPA: GNAT family N-acetyltransferase [Nannocystaceae bacterium]|nr:GNAT family N-acetyltransferase [Nannocystaceae bacterium]